MPVHVLLFGLPFHGTCMLGALKGSNREHLPLTILLSYKSNGICWLPHNEADFLFPFIPMSKQSPLLILFHTPQI